MSLFHRFLSLFRSSRLDRDMDAEMRAHLEQETARNIESGMTPEEARCAAQRAFGGLDQLREREHDARGWRWLEDSAHDVLHANRALRNSIGFTLVVVVTLALCLGANVTLFSVLRSIVLRPYPYPQSNRVVNIGMVWSKWQWGTMVQEISPPTFLYIKESARSFSACGFIDANEKSDLLVGAHPMRLNVARVTPGVWSVAQVQPAIGRVFSEQDVASHGESMVVLSEKLWREAFDRDPGIVGQHLRIDDTVCEVVGVMPAGFSLAANRTALWLPKVFSADERSENARGSHSFQAIARLGDGVTVEQARAELEALHARFLGTHDEARRFADQTGETYGVAPLTTWVGDRSSGQMLFSLQLAAGLVLLLGCLNVAGLLIVRGHGRLREICVRSALGASRIRIARQLATETLVLFLYGGVAAALVAAATLRILPHHFHLAEIMPYGQQIGFDGQILALTVALALATGIVTASFPILYATRRDVSGLLQKLSHQATGGPARSRVLSAFVIVQVALALTLLTAAGATVHNLRSLFASGFGVDTDHRIVVSAALPAYRYGSAWDFAATRDKINPLKEEALTQLRALPGVLSASVSNRVPLSSNWPAKFGFTAPGYVPAEGEAPGVAFAYAVFPGFFRTLGIPLHRGRDFDTTDTAETAPVAVISRSIADRYFADRDPIGARIRLLGRDCTIIGVVDETLNVPMTMGNAPALYVAARQSPAFSDEAAFVVHANVPTATLAASITRILTGLDSMLSVRVAELAQLQEGAVLTQRAPMEIAGLFSLLAILLSALGLYSVLASSVAQRTRELGVRLALGADQGAILRMILFRGGALAVVGIILGGLATFPMLHWIEPLLNSPDALRPDILVGAAVLIVVVCLLASYLPARRAARIDPVIALRAE